MDETPTITFSMAQAEDYFQFLWLKRVSGFNPGHHCVRCLKGSYSKDWPAPSRRDMGVLYEGSEDATKFDFLYLCGVHKSFELELNLHAPMRYAEGKITTINNEGVEATFINAELLLVPPLPETFDLTDDAAYIRCRNFQFGYSAYALDPGVIVLADDPETELSDWMSQSIRECQMTLGAW